MSQALLDSYYGKGFKVSHNKEKVLKILFLVTSVVYFVLFDPLWRIIPLVYSNPVKPSTKKGNWERKSKWTMEKKYDWFYE